MTTFKRIISRRTFIKASLQALALMVIPYINQVATTGATVKSTQGMAYGRGVYSQGTYPGSSVKTYLPVIMKKGG